MMIVKYVVFFLVDNAYYFLTALLVFSVFLIQGVYAFLNLEKAETKKKYSLDVIEATRHVIIRHLVPDAIIFTFLLFLTFLSFFLKSIHLFGLIWLYDGLFLSPFLFKTFKLTLTFYKKCDIIYISISEVQQLKI